MDTSALAALEPDQLEAQASTLLNKRLFEVSRLLPETLRAIGDSVRPAFFDYAQTDWPQGHRRHFEDGLAFCRYLLDRQMEPVNRAEFNRLRFIVDERRLAAHLVPDHAVGARVRPALQILWRRRGKPQETAIYVGGLRAAWSLVTAATFSSRRSKPVS